MGDFNVNIYQQNANVPCSFCMKVCKMATLADKLTLQVAAATYKDMLEMVESEKRLRKDLLDGVSKLTSNVVCLSQLRSEK